MSGTLAVQPTLARPPATVEYRVGTRLLPTAHRYAKPHDVAVAVPAVRSYRYMAVNDRVIA